MYVEQVLGSDTRIKVLRTLLQEALPQLSANQLMDETGRSRGGIHKALKELEGTGVVRSHKRGRTFHYSVNPEHPYTPILQDLFTRERTKDNVAHLFPTYWNHLEDIVSTLARDPGVQFVVLYGSLTRAPVTPEADMDLLVGTEQDEEVAGTDRRIMGHEVSVLALPIDEIREKMNKGDRFMESALERHVVLYRAAGLRAPWLRTPSPSLG